VKRAALGAFLVLAALFLVGRAPVAAAHTELILSEPADGSVVAEVPSQVVLTFSEELLPETVRISVADSTGLAVLVADPSVDADTVTATWPPGLTGTDFDVNYRVVSQDGHPVSGTVSFTTQVALEGRAPATPAGASPIASGGSSSAAPVPSASPVAEQESDRRGLSPVSIVFLGLAIGIGIGFVVMLARRGRTSA